MIDPVCNVTFLGSTAFAKAFSHISTTQKRNLLAVGDDDDDDGDVDDVDDDDDDDDVQHSPSRKQKWLNKVMLNALQRQSYK